MQPPRSRQTTVQGRIQYRLVFPQAGFRVFKSQVPKKLLGRNSNPPFEHPLKMIRAEAYLPSQLIKRRLVLKTLSQALNYPFYLVITIHNPQNNRG